MPFDLSHVPSPLDGNFPLSNKSLPLHFHAPSQHVTIEFDLHFVQELAQAVVYPTEENDTLCPKPLTLSSSLQRRRAS